MFARFTFLLVIVFLGFGFRLSAAQSVTPTRLQLDLATSPQAILTVSSTKPVDVALEFSIDTYSVANEAHESRESPLEILPPQVLLRPGETRQVLLRWRGGRQLSRSESYYLAIDELPLAVDGAESAAEIQLLTSLRLPVHVQVDGKAELGFFPPNIDGSASLELRNTGKQYALLSNYEIGVESDGKRLVFDGLAIARLLNRDAILPGQMVSVPLRLIGLEAAGLQGARLVRKE